MARDHALALTLAPGEAVLRLYRWSPATLSFGRNEPARGRWDLEALGEAGVAVVRRPTGGRAVLHHREVTYSVVMPLPDRGGLRPAYRAIGRALVDGLTRLGTTVDLATDTGRAAPPDRGPCFRAPEEGEVVARARKLVGSAQARLEGRLLQHGSVLLEDDQARLDGFRVGSTDTGGSSPATLIELLGRAPEPVEVADALVTGFRNTLPGDWPADPEGGTLPRETLRHERQLRGRYASESWTWRR